jgi:PAS domain S-box-containing protein
MLEPNCPPDEAERSAELRALQMLDTAPEERFDRVTRTAQRMFGVPIALISLVDVNRQWFKSRQGLDASETPRNISFCGHAILEEGVFVVENTIDDDRFFDNPLVLGGPNIRFYAGAPLHGPTGRKVGTLCIISPIARLFDAADIAALTDIGKWAEAELNATTLREATALAKSSEAKLQENMSLLTAVMGSTASFVDLSDIDGRYLYVNREYEKVFQHTLKEVIGKHVEDVLPAHLAHDYRVSELQAMRAGQSLHTESVVQQADGPHTYLIVRTPLYAEKNAGGNSEKAQLIGTCGVGTDITLEKNMAEQLRNTNAQLATTSRMHQAILNGANSSIISTDVDGLILTYNAGAEQMLGYQRTEVIGQSPAIFHSPGEVAARARELSAELGQAIEPGFDAFIAKARRGNADEHEWTYFRKDGSTLPVMLSVTALFDERQEVTGFLGIAYDLTERKRIEHMKSEFISTVSHELRTPLTSIRGSLGLLTAGAVGEIPAKAKPLLDIASKNCERLVRLINDILDIEKIESGHMRFDFSEQSLQALVEQAIAMTQAYAAQFSVRFVLQVEGAIGNVSGDADRLIQVIVNLLSNASKFSPFGGSVKVRLALTANNVRLSVIDHGEGIADEFRGRIFQKFAQADSSDTRGKGGTGLGLNISKAIVEKHHGSIGFYSERGKGTEFYVDLPLLVEQPLSGSAAMRGACSYL